MKRSAVDRFNVAIRIATESRDPDDLARAEVLYRERDAEYGVSSPNAMQRIENLGGLMTIRRLQGDLAGSAAVLEDMLQVYVDHPEFSFGRNIVHTRLAELWLLDQDRAADAERLVRRVIGEDVELLGESLVTARGGYLLARALLRQGRLDEARQALDNAAAVHGRHSGGAELPPEYRLTDWLIDLQAGHEGEQRLADLREQVAALPPESPWHEAIRLAELYRRVADDPSAVDDVGERLGPRPAIDLEAIHLHDLIRERLEAMRFDRRVDRRASTESAAREVRLDSS